VQLDCDRAVERRGPMILDLDDAFGQQPFAPRSGIVGADAPTELEGVAAAETLTGVQWRP
jgi:hypothetical protein